MVKQTPGHPVVSISESLRLISGHHGYGSAACKLQRLILRIRARGKQGGGGRGDGYHSRITLNFPIESRIAELRIFFTNHASLP